MPGWGDILREIENTSSNFDLVRRKYLKNLSELTNRNVIAYYSGWLQFPQGRGLDITDNDMNGFMETVRGLDRSKGLDLLIHTPGGDIAATESIVAYLQKMFNGDIRVIVPLLAMSAGTMIACSASKILMGKESSLGPTDPQITIQTVTGIKSVPALALLDEFARAEKECKEDPHKLSFWHPILSQYHPGFIIILQNSVELSKELTRAWLKNNMFRDDSDRDKIVDVIVSSLCNHKDTKAHGRHLPATKCKELGLKIEMLEDNQALQDAVLSVHHAYIITLTSTSAIKIIENHNGQAFMIQANKAT